MLGMLGVLEMLKMIWKPIAELNVGRAVGAGLTLPVTLHYSVSSPFGKNMYTPATTITLNLTITPHPSPNSALVTMVKRRAATANRNMKKPRHLAPPSPDVITLPDLVTLLHLQIVPFLSPHDLSRLLRCLSHLLKPALSESLATFGLQTFYERDSVHLGQKCCSDWHQLVPEEAEGGEGICIECFPAPPKDLPLPRLHNARVHLLEAMCLADEGLTAVCDGVLQMHYGQFASPRFGSMQPVVFSLAEALEMQLEETNNKPTKSRKVEEDIQVDEIDTDDVEQLTRLMDTVQMGVGTQFFSGRKQNCTPANAVEAHWRSIVVDLETGTTICRYCQFITEHSSKHRCERCTQVFARLLQQHCAALYQPLKLFMLQHLKHVRYVKPCRGWNCTNNDFQGDYLMDLIAGFTPAGVLCGVYLTDLRILPRMISDRLAMGAFKPVVERRPQQLATVIAAGAVATVYQTIYLFPACSMPLDRSFERRQYGVLQPVVFSLAAALEDQLDVARKSGQQLDPINVKDVAELTHLMDSLETNFGSRFFRSTDCSPAGMVEAHWKNIHVNLAADTTYCHFCDVNTDIMVEGPLNPQFREAEYEFLMRQHCRDVYQPLKKFMTRHLQHVRYVRPPRGWNEAGNNFQGNEWLDLIAGFTPGGVLCGVYLTDIRIPSTWINDRLAPGAYPFDENAIDLTRLRIAY
ncbi:hypothetical protein JG687_00011025 [Phytophthora cactorum]|uniref:Uncharacterized protein n=1 Tax=Phytophthora cactorum TaxID=29920 RepID=A0A8T1U5N9_9STRA|nr:hypothetical protein JG687_00011025 [Phytophthora cactorum]